MLGFLRRPKPTRPSAVEGAVWAIGDIHGCHDLLAALIKEIRGTDPAGDATRIIFLGDYVDRGPGSKQVLDLLIALGQAADVEAVFIRGNHEQMMVSFVDDPKAGPAWVGMGGGETLASYSVQTPPLGASASAWRDVRDRFVAALPETHLAFLKALQPSVEIGDYFFTHAGVRPNRPLDQQKITDLMWIRDAFLEDNRVLSKVIVHGHTPAASPFSDARRVGVDTGAYASGVLTATLLEGEDRKFLQVRRGELKRGVPTTTTTWATPMRTAK